VPTPPSPSPVSASARSAADAVRDSLYAVFSNVADPTTALAAAFDDACSWETPLFRCSSRAAMAEQLSSFMSFFLEPCIHFTSHRNCDNGTAIDVDWLVSFTYPLPWRPRITVSGKSRATFATSRSSFPPGLVVSVIDEWDVSVWNIFSQSLPRLTDILWLYPAPHAETDDGTRKVLSKHDGYSIVRFAARPELRYCATLSRNEVPYVRAVPALPSIAFVGRLRRKEDYSTVSPISVRCVDGASEYEWAIPVPGTMFGSGTGLPKLNFESPDSKLVDTPARRCAVVRYRGYALTEAFDKKLSELVTSLQRDGYLPQGQDVEYSRVWARSYDSKVGFNSQSMLAIATYGTTRGLPPRLNELVVELPEEE
jgi:hypothetical protein